MVTTLDFLFRPLSDQASFRIKKKPNNRLNKKWEEISFPLHKLDKSIKIYTVRKTNYVY